MSDAKSGVPPAVVRALGYTFAGRTTAALSDVSLTLAPGTWTLVTGPTGSGKTTLLRALAGLIPHHAAGEMQGEVHLFGENTRHMHSVDLARAAGLVLQSPDEQICTSTAESEVAFGLQNLCLTVAEIESRLGHWLARLGLADCRHQSTSTLSGGQKQRLVLASILAMGPQLLLLDEPLAQLDAQGAAELLATLNGLRDEGLTIVVCEHRLAELMEVVDRVVVLERGKLVGDGRSDDSQIRELLTANDTGGRDDRASGECSIEAQSPTAEPVLKAAKLAQQFPGQNEPVWADVNVDIRRGDVTALVGANGAGKSTLLATLCGLQTPAAGCMEFARGSPGTWPVGFVPQNPDLTLFCRTVREELSFGPSQLGLERAEIGSRVQKVAVAFSVADLLEELPLALSQGQRLRVAVASVVTLHPRLLLLDEPTIGQDAREVDRLLGAIARMVAVGDIGAVMFSTHDLSLVSRYARSCLVLTARRGISCSTNELLRQSELLRAARLSAGTHGRRSDRSATAAALDSAPGGGR